MRSTYGGSAKAEPPRWSGGSRAGLETRVSWRADSPARASTSAVAKTTDGASDKCPSGALLSRRRRRDADVGDDARCGDDAPARRGNANRVGAAHQSDFVMRRTPPRHPPRGPPRIRQCRSQRRTAEHFETTRDGVVSVLTKPSVQLACRSRTCRPADGCAGAPRERGSAGPRPRRARSAVRGTDYPSASFNRSKARSPSWIEAAGVALGSESRNRTTRSPWMIHTR